MEISSANTRLQTCRLQPKRGRQSQPTSNIDPTSKTTFTHASHNGCPCISCQSSDWKAYGGRCPPISLATRLFLLVHFDIEGNPEEPIFEPVDSPGIERGHLVARSPLSQRIIDAVAEIVDQAVLIDRSDMGVVE